ncbi:MAG: hypothetical protein A2Y10_03505 [Planctomycetes bacterium GWF2_41_51]|nr:MAG: hypothetical protein A2Y10_03505 [Planctomycetes bacterium GWF2_41_51]HBG28953.1 hypothetical protein [Phycisphaerales bacterium]
MIKEIKMPDVGTTVESVILIKWLKKEGEQVKRGESICEVQTDKANVEIESIASGVLLKQIVAEDSEISVGTIIAYIGEPGESIPK